eukprot:5079019-Ditylum_brightwellii.AAC.1
MLRDAESYVVELDDYIIHDDNNGETAKIKRGERRKGKEGLPILLHASGDLSSMLGVTDEEFGLHRPNSLLLQRSAESYQWEETRTERRTRRQNDDRFVDVEVTYRYSKTWSQRKINSVRFEEPWVHKNPISLPMEPGTTTHIANDIKLLADNHGDGTVWNVPRSLLEQSDVGKRFKTVQDLGRDEATSVYSPHHDDGNNDITAYISENSGRSMVYLPFSGYAGRKNALSNLPDTSSVVGLSASRTESSKQLGKHRQRLSIQRYADKIRHPPDIGDTRVFWSEVVAPPEGVSILASIATESKQEGFSADNENGTFVPWKHERTKRSVYLMVPGIKSAKEIIDYLRERNVMMGWILRLTGW